MAGDQVESLFDELLPVEVRELLEDLAKLDQLLSDPHLLTPIQQGVLPGSLLVLGVDAIVRQQRAPSPYTQQSLPERYRVADDFRRPLADVVAVAEQEAITVPAHRR